MTLAPITEDPTPLAAPTHLPRSQADMRTRGVDDCNDCGVAGPHQQASGRKPTRLTPAQVLTLLPQHLGSVQLNVRTGDVHTSKGGILSANEIGRLYMRLSTHDEIWPKEPTADAVALLANGSQFDPVLDYLEGIAVFPLPFDQWSRLDRHLLGIDDTIAAAFLTRFFISAVARAYLPGCSIRQTPVLIGPQWRGKSAMGRILFGLDHWVEEVGRLDRDDLMRCRTAWGVELGELDGVTRRSDQEALKTFLTSRVDTYRAPYDRAVERHPRRFVFWGTSNGPPLRDATGSSRFVTIPIPDRNLPLDWATDYRDALWARAVEQYKAGVQWDHVGEKERQAIAARNEDFREVDPWAEPVRRFLAERQREGRLPVQVQEVLKHLSVPVERQHTRDAARVRQLAESLGWRTARRTAAAGERVQGLWPACGH
jgi:predicted P-loop ATPase